MHRSDRALEIMAKRTPWIMRGPSAIRVSASPIPLPTRLASTNPRPMIPCTDTEAIAIPPPFTDRWANFVGTSGSGSRIAGSDRGERTLAADDRQIIWGNRSAYSASEWLIGPPLLSSGAARCGQILAIAWPDTLNCAANRVAAMGYSYVGWVQHGFHEQAGGRADVVGPSAATPRRYAR